VFKPDHRCNSSYVCVEDPIVTYTEFSLVTHLVLLSRFFDLLQVFGAFDCVVIWFEHETKYVRSAWP